MQIDHHNFACNLTAGFYADRPKEPPSRWCSRTLRFDEPDNRGPYTLSGREYAREPLDGFADANITDEVLVFGSQTGKTAIIMGGNAWTIDNEPSRIFWVMPTKSLVLSFSKTRWTKMLLASGRMAELIPTGAKRHDFTSLQQQIGSSIVDFVWSNSPSALSSTPARVVILDEVDKFPSDGRNEADAVNLAEQRTKNFANPKRIKTSTPTIVEGLIWQEFAKTDQRRRFVPCPHCGKHVIFAWSKEYTILPKTGSEAYIVWDKNAKRTDGWDLDRVEQSARALCPHNGCHILDAHKTKMDRQGEWRPTAKAAGGYRGWHLPSLYAASVETSFGKLARKFLQAKNSLLGLQGFINGDLAEPYQLQDRMAERVEVITSRVEITAEWKKLLTIDCQQKAPLFWYAARAWNGGDSDGIDAGYLDSWEDVRSKQLIHNIDDAAVCIDSGFGAKSDSEVYVNCARFGEFLPRQGAKDLHLGWLPSKGMPGRKRWKVDDLLVPFTLRDIDPYLGKSNAGQVTMSLLEFSSDFFKDIIESLRRGKGGYTWTVQEKAATEVYWRHMDSELKTAIFNKFTGRTTYNWAPRSKHWPNHIFDCEVLQIAYATFLGMFKEILTKTNEH